MELYEAFSIVIQLAQGNMVDPRDDEDEYEKQQEAVDLIEELATDKYGAG